MFEKPTLFFRNILRDARKGSDGTSYAACAQSVTDPDDPFKARGSLSLADPADYSLLPGLNVEFGLTKNPYRITAVTQGPAQKNTYEMTHDQRSAQAALIVGSYLYLGCLYSIVKIDTTTKKIVNSLPVGGIWGLCTDSAQAYLYVNEGATKIHKIALSDFSLVKTFTINAGSTGSFDICSLGNYIYVPDYNATDSKLYRIDASDNVTTLVLTGKAYLSNIAASGTYLYGGLASYSTGVLIRIDVPTFSYKDQITLTAGENNPHRLYIDGTKLYVGLDSGKVARVDINAGAFSESGTAIALASQTAAMWGLTSDTTYLYCSGLTSVAKISRITKASWTEYGSPLSLSSGENNCYALTVLSGQIYPALSSDPGKFCHVATATFLEVTADTFTLNRGSEYIYDMVEYKGYFYAIVYSLFFGKILKIAPDGTVVDEHVHSTGVYFTCIIAINDFLYIGSQVTNGKVYKVALDGVWTEAGSITLSDAAYVNSICSYAGSIYTGAAAGKVSKIDVTTMTQVGSSITVAGGMAVYALLLVGSNLYATNASSPSSYVGKIDLLTFTVTTNRQLASGENLAESLAADATYLYVGCSGKIARITLSDFLEHGTALSLSGSWTIPRLYLDGQLLIAGVQGFKKICLVSTTSFTETGALTLSASYSDLFSGLIYNHLLYVPAYEGGRGYSKINTIDCFSSLTFFERLQDTDIGDSFTIRAGLEGVNEDPARPAIYAADGHTAPRAKGLVNAALKIRAHAPNFIEDGGFESGAFAPNWTAGVNWAIEIANKLEGAYSAKWNGAADNTLAQTSTDKLKKNKTYTVLFKAEALTANPTQGIITVNAKQSGSGTAVYGAISGNQPAITTTAAWFSVDIVPDFTTDNWYLEFSTDLTKLGSCTGIIIDEVYVYEKKTINSLIVDKHNWAGKTGIIVNAWRLSPLRSTATSDSANKSELANFNVDTADTILQTLTSSTWPVYELVIPAVSGWAMEAGEIFVGSGWQVPRYAGSPLDPRGKNADGLRKAKLTFKNLDPSYRLAQIQELFDSVGDNEAVWFQWDTDAPVLMEDKHRDRDAPYAPRLVNFDLDLVERL